MQKLLIGCAAVLLIVGAICCGGVVWVGYQVNRTIAGWTESFEALGQLDERYPYEPPEGRTLEPNRLDAYLAARTEVVEQLSQRNRIARAFLQQEEEILEEMGPFRFFREFFALLPATMTTVESALDQREMSLSETAYIIQTSYLTMLLGADMGDERMESIFEQLISGAEGVNETLDDVGNVEQEDRLDVQEAIDNLRRLRDTVPQENYDLIAERREQFLQYPAIAYLEFLFLTASDEVMEFDPDADIQFDAEVEF